MLCHTVETSVSQSFLYEAKHNWCIKEPRITRQTSSCSERPVIMINIRDAGGLMINLMVP